MKQADLNPALGRPGGPCQVVRRIIDEVRDPRWSEDLTSKVEEGEDLSNAEAAKIYDLQSERCRGIATKMWVGPHTQYRMDLRKVTMGDLRKAMEDFAREFHEERTQGSMEFKRIESLLDRGEKIKYISNDGLAVVFVLQDDRAIRLVTTFWDGVPDPSAPKQCRLALRVAARFQLR